MCWQFVGCPVSEAGGHFWGRAVRPQARGGAGRNSRVEGGRVCLEWAACFALQGAVGRHLVLIEQVVSEQSSFLYVVL